MDVGGTSGARPGIRSPYVRRKKDRKDRKDKEDNSARVVGAYLSASALSHQQHLRGGTAQSSVFSLFFSLVGPPARSARRLSSSASAQLPTGRPASCDPSTHLLFEHRGHNTRQVECESTPRGQRVPVVRPRAGVQIWSGAKARKLASTTSRRSDAQTRSDTRTRRHPDTPSDECIDFPIPIRSSDSRSFTPFTFGHRSPLLHRQHPLIHSPLGP